MLPPQVYRATTEGIISKVMGGFNGTVFAYGQTSSGKTHTMMGAPHEPGIVPLAVRAIFDHIEATQDREFLLRVSYMEVRSAHASLLEYYSIATVTHTLTAHASTRQSLRQRMLHRRNASNLPMPSDAASIIADHMFVGEQATKRGPVQTNDSHAPAGTAAMSRALGQSAPGQCMCPRDWRGPTVRATLPQMYNEEVNDLLAPENKKLAVHESREQGVYVAGLREDIVTSATQARRQADGAHGQTLFLCSTVHSN